MLPEINAVTMLLVGAPNRNWFSIREEFQNKEFKP